MGEITPVGRDHNMARPESLNALHSIEILLHLLRLAGDRLLVIWVVSRDH